MVTRGKPRETAILSAALELVAEVGYEALTIDAVAARARASKATVYRRWRNKAELVRAALDTLDAADNATIPDTGALRSDLLAVLEAMRKKASAAYVSMISDLVAASRREPALAEALRAHVENDELSPFRAVLLRAVKRKELPAHADTALVHDVAEAMVIRQLQAGLTLDRAFQRRVVDEVLLPLLAAKRSRR